MEERCKTCREWEEHVYWNHCPRIKSFFKALVGDFSQYICIPRKFIENFKEELSETIKLKGPSGRRWHVGLKKINSGAFFHNGWEEFVKAHSLQVMDMLVFTYSGNSSFDVVIFDQSGYEKEFHSGDKERAQKSVYLESRQANFKERSTHEHGTASRSLNSPQSYTPSTSSSEESSTHSRESMLSSATNTRGRTTYKKLFISGRRPVTGIEREAALRLAYERQQTRPSFLCVMKPSNVYKLFYLTIPRKFAAKHIPPVKISITLNDNNSRNKWHVTITHRKYSTVFTGRWSMFVLDNNLEEGDVCVFELMDPQSLEMKVHIFRVVERIVRLRTI